MNLSYNWLNQYVDLSQYTVDEITHELTLAGLEVEQVHHLAKANNLVVGQVKSVENHPDADTLKVCQVDLGEEELSQIVCGAANVATNQKVIVAKVGAKLPELTIKPVSIRGVDSNGMICSLSELGVDPKHLSEEQLAGIEVLADDAKIGDTNVLSYLGLDDKIIEIDLTPNRTDCLAMFNMAKEVGAILDQKVILPTINDNSKGEKSNFKIGIESKNSERLAVKLINNIKIKPSIPWMKKILISNGIKPINNVVDISNIVMLETGQPLHFYDAKKLPKKQLIIKDGYREKYIALDENEYTLREKDLVITSDNKVIGIAGIMGGQDSKITNDTTSILIESAHFDQTTIRISARELNIQSEAANRFAKGIDPNALDIALNRAVDLLIKYADASDLEETLTVGKQDLERKEITTTASYLNNRLGTNYSQDQIVSVLNRLDFKPSVNDDVIITHIPTYRRDIKAEVDLSEEVVRIIGVDKLESTLPKISMRPGKITDFSKQEKQIKDILLGAGYNEVITYSLISDAQNNLAVLPIGKPVVIANPISNDRKYYRTSLLASMLDVLSHNEARSNFEYSLFEIANVYSDDNKQEERLTIAISENHQLSAWQNLSNYNDFYTIKGLVYELLSQIGISEERIEVKANDLEVEIFHPYQSGAIYVDRKLFGLMGVLHPKFAKDNDLKGAVVGEFILDTVYDLKKAKVKYKEIPKYPGISRDIAVIVDKDLPAIKLINLVKQVNKGLVSNVEVFDVYEGDNIKENQKSIALRVYFQALDKTLKDTDINNLYKKTIDKLVSEYNVIYREK